MSWIGTLEGEGEGGGGGGRGKLSGWICGTGNKANEEENLGVEERTENIEKNMEKMRETENKTERAINRWIYRLLEKDMGFKLGLRRRYREGW